MIRKLSFRLFFLSSLVLLQVLPFSNAIFAQGLELRIDSDNNGTIDNSPRERELAKCPYAFGKFIPYSETDEEFVEFQVVVPKAKSVNEKRTLKFTFESNEVSLWEEMPNGKKVCLYKPDVKGTIQTETKTTPVDNSEETEAATDDSDPEEAEDEATDQKENSLWGLGKRIIGEVAQKKDVNILNGFLNINIDEVQPDKPVSEFVETVTSQTFEYPVSSAKSFLKFYLKAEVKPRPADWQNSKTIQRPTRTLTVDLILNGNSIVLDSAKYMVVNKKSIYVAIQIEPLLSEAIAARSLYYNNPNVMKYGLQFLDLNDLGISSKEFNINDSGFRAQFYRDWVHDKYYVVFRGTDIKIDDIRNDFLLCTGKPSPYLWNALKLGCDLREKLPVKIREKTVIVGHSLGGALASGACITSGITTDTFNALGLSYQTLKYSVDKYGTNDPSSARCIALIEKCFMKPKKSKNPNDRIFITESVPLSTFNTQSDILTQFELCCQNVKLQTKDGSVLNIPLALGAKIEIKKTEQNLQNDSNNINKLRNVIRSVFYIIEQCDSSNTDSFQSRVMKGINILGNDILGGKISTDEMKDQIEIATRSHQMEAVIEEILILSGMPEAYGIRQ